MTDARDDGEPRGKRGGKAATKTSWSASKAYLDKAKALANAKAEEIRRRYGPKESGVSAVLRLALDELENPTRPTAPDYDALSEIGLVSAVKNIDQHDFSRDIENAKILYFGVPDLTSFLDANDHLQSLVGRVIYKRHTRIFLNLESREFRPSDIPQAARRDLFAISLLKERCTRPYQPLLPIIAEGTMRPASLPRERLWLQILTLTQNQPPAVFTLLTDTVCYVGHRVDFEAPIFALKFVPSGKTSPYSRYLARLRMSLRNEHISFEHQFLDGIDVNQHIPNPEIGDDDKPR